MSHPTNFHLAPPVEVVSSWKELWNHLLQTSNNRSEECLLCHKSDNDLHLKKNIYFDTSQCQRPALNNVQVGDLICNNNNNNVNNVLLLETQLLRILYAPQFEEYVDGPIVVQCHPLVA